MAALSFNTAIARLFELNNHLTTVVQRDGARAARGRGAVVLMVAPLAPHIAEELWPRLGHDDTLTYESFPIADPAVAGRGARSRSRCRSTARCARASRFAVGADAAAHEAAGAAPSPASPSCWRARPCASLKVVPGKIVNFVVA